MKNKEVERISDKLSIEKPAARRLLQKRERALEFLAKQAQELDMGYNQFTIDKWIYNMAIKDAIEIVEREIRLGKPPRLEHIPAQLESLKKWK